MESLGAKHELELLEVKRMPRKSLALRLISLAYLQISWRTAVYLFRAKPDAGQ